MENKTDFTGLIILIMIVSYVFGIYAVYSASKKRNVETYDAILAAVLLSPIGGFLYCLCFPSICEEETSEAIKRIHDKLNK